VKDILFKTWVLAVGITAAVAWFVTLFGVLAFAPSHPDAYAMFTASVVSIFPPTVILAGGLRVADRIW
tara:strand:+ start:155 stop:358 length:204 start_codon:yes stop_codon:yes gene_type:complete